MIAELVKFDHVESNLFPYDDEQEYWDVNQAASDYLKSMANNKTGPSNTTPEGAAYYTLERMRTGADLPGWYAHQQFKSGVAQSCVPCVMDKTAAAVCFKLSIAICLVVRDYNMHCGLPVDEKLEACAVEAYKAMTRMQD